MERMVVELVCKGETLCYSKQSTIGDKKSTRFLEKIKLKFNVWKPITFIFYITFIFWKDDTYFISFQWPYFESASLHYCQVFCFHFPSMDLIQFDSAVAVDFPLDFLKGFFDKHIIGNIFS